MSLWSKIIRANDIRPTRFHSEKGKLVGFRGALNAPRALLTSILRRLFNIRPRLPWIPQSAIPRLESLIQPTWRIMEFGSGMSTLWYAQRAQHVKCIEHNPEWHAFLKEKLQKDHMTNVECVLREPDTYISEQDLEDPKYDLVVVDGLRRSECIKQALHLIKPGGWIDLDNTEQNPNDPEGDMRIAEDALLNACSGAGERTHYFVDFAPAQFFVTEGLLAQPATPPKAEVN